MQSNPLHGFGRNVAPTGISTSGVYGTSHDSTSRYMLVSRVRSFPSSRTMEATPQSFTGAPLVFSISNAPGVITVIVIGGTGRDGDGVALAVVAGVST